MTEPPFDPGDRIADTYEIRELIGSGGYSRVYRATDKGLGREVALKIMAEDESEETDTGTKTERFIREARHCSKLDSPHAVTLHDYGRLPDGPFYIVLEYIDGTTLEETIDRQGRLAPDRIEHIVSQLLDVLAEAHESGILHRDIKPSNVMLFERRGREDRVKLLDFGIAKKVAWERIGGEDLTREGKVLGTPRYMSPEQLRQLPLTPASDLFSVGLLIYEMWVGNSPYDSQDITLIFGRMQEFEDDIGELNSAPEPIRSVGAQLLKPDPDERLQSAETVLAALSRGGPKPNHGTTDLSSAGSEATETGGFTRSTDTPPPEANRVDSTHDNFPVAGAESAEEQGQTSGVSSSQELRVSSATTRSSVLPAETRETPESQVGPPLEVQDESSEHRRWRIGSYPALVVLGVVGVVGASVLFLAFGLFTGEARSPDTEPISKGGAVTSTSADGRTVSPPDAPSGDVAEAEGQAEEIPPPESVRTSLRQATEQVEDSVRGAQREARRESKAESPSQTESSEPENRVEENPESSVRPRTHREPPSNSEEPSAEAGASEESEPDEESVPLEPLE